MRLLSFKKGQAKNYFAVIMWLFAFGFISIMGYLILNSYITEFDNAGYADTEVHDTGVKFLQGISYLDNVIIVVMVILIIGIGITSFKLAAPPLFFLINFIMAAVYGFISFFMNFIFQEIVSDTIFTATLLFFPNTVLICTNLHWVMLVCIIVGSITLFGKKEKGQFLA
jgi:hypothetical protein